MLAKLDLWRFWKETTTNEIYLLPKELHEKVARLHLLALGTKLTVSAQEQTVYPGVKVEGPFKRINYRY